MDPIQASFMIIKVEDNIWDVAIFGEPSVLEAFSSVYDAHYVHESVFEKRPMAIIPDCLVTEYSRGLILLAVKYLQR